MVDPVLLPVDVSRGSEGGANFSTTIVESQPGFEDRNINWADARGQWTISFDVLSQEDRDTLIAFQRACYGSGYGFLFNDVRDSHGQDQQIGTGDGSTTHFQIVKSYSNGYRSSVRTITRPVAGSVSIKVNGTTLVSGWSVNTTTGVVTFSSAPASGATITATYDFYVPVRFGDDAMRMGQDGVVASWSGVSLIEVRE